MAKNIGVLAAVAFVLSVEGVTAATISESRLHELMSSTSEQAVALETLRARDREILEELARSLATRYSDVLAGSELVFSRLSEAGSVFYRLDFIGLKNRDRARALCEILEMERCIAKIGDDRLTVLDVRADPTVAAIAVLEEEAEPFSYFEGSPQPETNPKAREIEARVRNMLDPLGVFPEPRPDMGLLMETGGSVPPEAPAENSVNVPKQDSPEAPPAPEGRKEASLGAHPVPVPRPGERIADLLAPAEEAARPKPELSDKRAEQRAGRDVVIASDLRIERSIVPRDRFGDYFEDGFIELADAGAAPVRGFQEKRQEMSPVIRLPGIGEIDMAAIRVPVVQIEEANIVFPGMKAPMSASQTAVGRVMERSETGNMVRSEFFPKPLSRSAALQDLQSRQAPPQPRLRQLALIEIAPEPEVMTRVAALSAPAIEGAGGPETTMDKPVETALVRPGLLKSRPDAAFDAPASPDPRRRMVAAAAAAPMVQDPPRRINIEIPKPIDLAGAEPGPKSAKQDPWKEDGAGEIARLGRVFFDDRYARPSPVDFNSGRTAGRLQKLPFRRPDLTALLHKTEVDIPIHEEGYAPSLAMVSSPGASFEVAQVPGGMVSPEEDLPFLIKQEAPEEVREKSALDRLLSGEGDVALPPGPAAGATSGQSREESRGAGNANLASPPVLSRPGLPALDAGVPKDESRPKNDVQDESGQGKDFTAAEPSQAGNEVRAVEDEQARQRRALETLTEIVKERRRSEDLARDDLSSASQEKEIGHERRMYQPEGTMQRRPAPRGPYHGNTDLSAAREVAGYESGFSDDRTKMARAADPGRASGLVERMQQSAASGAVAPADLRIELSYVGDPGQVSVRAEELKRFFPPVMLEKGRFFGASVPGQPDRFVVGIAAQSIDARDDLVWYMEQMGIPWAIR